MVSALREETRARRQTETDGDGHFSLPALPPGEYVLEVNSRGFATAVVGKISISVGGVVVERVAMQPAGVVSRLEVKEQAGAVDVEASTASAAIGGEAIEEAPARSRNYLNFVLSAPGAAPSAGSSSQRTMTGTRSALPDSGFTFAGVRPRNNSVQIDGLDNRDETTGGSRVPIGLEMVQEFRVAASATGAELGGAAGGLLNLVTRSGTNLWHGDFTFFAQNGLFNARRSEVDSGTPEFQRYQPGTSINGPLRRDRTFFSFAVEHERETADEWSNVPAEALAPINQALATPAFAGFDGGGLRAYRGLFPTESTGTDYSLKLNDQVSSQDALTLRYAGSNGRVEAEVQGPDNFADRSAQGSSRTIDNALAGSWLRVLSPSSVNEVRVQVASRTMELRPNAEGPMLEIPGVATLGGYWRLNSNRSERHYQVVDNWNWSGHRHRLSLGGETQWISMEANFHDRHAGIWVFPDLASFGAARPDMFLQAFGQPATRMRTVPLGAWVQDRWELRPGFNLEMGARFDRQIMPSGISASSNNVSPRAGIAWQPSTNRQFVLRAGFGLFYDRYPLAFLNPALQLNGVQGFEQYETGVGAARLFAMTQGGALTAPDPFTADSTWHTAAHLPSTYSRKITGGFEYGLARNTSLGVEWSDIDAWHLPRTRNITGTLPPTYELEQTARSRYEGISITLNRKLARELSYLVSYSAGRTFDDASDFDEQPLDPMNTRRDWSYSRQHQSQRLAASALFDLPEEILPPALRRAFADISIAPIFTVGSGRPINALLTTDLYRTGAFPISARPVGLNRNPFLSPATSSLDVRVMKTIRVLEGRALLQFGVESFNVLNHTNPERVSSWFATPEARLASYDGIIESLPARQVQFMAQFEY